MDIRKIIWPTAIALFFLVTVLGTAAGYLFLYSDGVVPKIRTVSEREFLNFLSRKKKLPLKNEEVSLIAVGDISYSRGVERVVGRQQNMDYPLAKITDYLSGADLVFGNLETPITSGRPIADGEMVFRSNPGTEQALNRAGFSILSLANNHSGNFGEAGLHDTFTYLKKSGLFYTGAGENAVTAYQPVYVEKKGIRFAFLAYVDEDLIPPVYEATDRRAGVAVARIDKMAIAVKTAKQEADVVIVSLHSGIEYTGVPDEGQTSFARAAIDAGADVVLGHHPHVVQTMEQYQGKYIFYSLGNFVFDQPWSSETEEGLAVKIYFTRDGVRKITFLPVVMENLAQPRPADEAVGANILARLKFPGENRIFYFWDSQNGVFATGSEAVIDADIAPGENYRLSEATADLDNNLIFEKYHLADGRLTITENEKTLWQSPHEWWIDSFVLADSNNDGVGDINLSLWKAGNFGASQPFWVVENDSSVKNHFFILNLAGGEIKQVWGSSNLRAPNCEFKIADIDYDGKNELVVIEGDYATTPECRGEYIAVWRWNGWGFGNEWRSEPGSFFNLEMEKINGENKIIADSF